MPALSAFLRRLPRRVVIPTLLLVLALYVALGWRSGAPQDLGLSAEAVARGRSLDDAARRAELQDAAKLERAAAPRRSVANGDPRLLEAARRLLPLAEAGLVPAQVRLARLYLNGWGAKPDLCSATYWFDRAARAGDAMAQLQLALAYLPPNGAGIVADNRLAYLWARAAQRQEHAAAVELLFLFERDLTPEERRDVEARLDSFDAAAMPPAEIKRYPYVPILVGLWPRQFHDVAPCRQEQLPFVREAPEPRD